MKIVIPGGTGQIGTLLRCALIAQGHEVVIVCRHPVAAPHVLWDGRSLGPWADEIDGADAVINLAGRTASCRYTEDNLAQMMSSRVDSTRVVGDAIAAASKPPGVWLQMSTATVYADTRGDAQDEATGVIGGDEPRVPAYWERSVRIARAWEAALLEADLPETRRVALRAAMVMSPDRGGVFDVLSWLTRLGLGGPVAGGGQYVSWIHDRDFVRVVSLLLESELSGAVNVCAPTPLPQRQLMRGLRQAWRRPGLPATAWMAEIGAWVLRSDTELLLKSRRVVPGRLLDAGFVFEHPTWPEAAADLVRRRKALGAKPQASRGRAETGVLERHTQG